jgi:hypothetical protein
LSTAWLNRPPKNSSDHSPAVSISSAKRWTITPPLASRASKRRCWPGASAREVRQVSWALADTVGLTTAWSQPFTVSRSSNPALSPRSSQTVGRTGTSWAARSRR